MYLDLRIVLILTAEHGPLLIDEERNCQNLKWSDRLSGNSPWLQILNSERKADYRYYISSMQIECLTKILHAGKDGIYRLDLP